MVEISSSIKEKAPLILAEIKKAKHILLHCHPSPDPDSVGSALAMKFALEQLGKKVTVIRGDSEIPAAFSHFPGMADIAPRNFFEIDLKEFDLFIIQDSGGINMVSNLQPITLPLSIRSIVIDHHSSNRGYGDVNLIDTTYPACALILYELFVLWGIKIDRNIAANLFIGTYTDTGGFKYDGTTTRTFAIAGELIKLVPDFARIISDMENSNSPEFLAFLGKALSSAEGVLNNKMGLSLIPYGMLTQTGMPISEVSASVISPFLRSVRDWDVTAVLFEAEPNHVKVSFRSKDATRFDVSKLAVALGGGGHKAAAGATLLMSLAEAKEKVASTAKELYNL